MSDPVVVVAAIIRDGNRVLLTRRRQDAHLGGLWEFPGGKVEEGESLEEALVREIFEELGMTIRPGKLYFEKEHVYPDRTVHLHFFECRIVEGAPQARDVADFRWTPPEDLDRFEFPDANRPLIRKLRSETQ